MSYADNSDPCGSPDEVQAKTRTQMQTSAMGKVAHAIKIGRLPKPVECEICECTRNVMYHHASYLEEHALDVVALCRSCHSNVHNGKIPDPGLLILGQNRLVQGDRRRAGRRPRPGARMAATLRIRVSAAEQADLEARAAETGIGVPELLRSILWPEGEPR